MKFEHCGMVLDSASTEDALYAVKYFGHLPVEFMSQVEAGFASPALTRVYNWIVDPDRVAKTVNLTGTDLPLGKQPLQEGMVDLPETEGAEVQKLLTFTSIPQENLLAARAADLAQIAVQAGATHALIAGAPYLMAHLERALKQQGIQPLYWFHTGGFVYA